MFILEGADGVGKTTFAKAMCKHAEYLSYGALGVLPDHWQIPQDYVNLVGIRVIQDRFTWSEEVYGKIYRNGPRSELTNPHVRRLLMRCLNYHCAMQVLLTARPNVIRERFKQGKHENFVDPEKNCLCDLEFYKSREEQDVLTLVHRTDDTTEADPAWYVGYYENRFRTRLQYDEIQEATDGWGSFWPKYILVGYEYGSSNPHDSGYHKAFGANTPCCRYLTRLLDIANVNEQDLWVTNVCQEGGTLTQRELRLLSTYNPLIIALGKDADSWLSALGISHVEFPHPQYLRRFHSRDWENWGWRLRELLQVGRSAAQRNSA